MAIPSTFRALPVLGAEIFEPLRRDAILHQAQPIYQS
jgi:hypothetical protein